MQNIQPHTIAPSHPLPGACNRSKEETAAPRRVDVTRPDTRTESEKKLDEELAALLGVDPALAKDEEREATLNDASTPREEDEPGATLTQWSPSEEDEEHTADVGDKASAKAPRFQPTTTMKAGKVKWEGRFVAVPHALLTHEGFAELPGTACKLLLAMLSQYVGSNNGHLVATASFMKRFGIKSKESLAQGIQTLIMFGYIIRTRSHQRRMPARYALTWLPINRAPVGEPYDSGVEQEDEASDLWRHFDPSMAEGAEVYH